MSKQKIEHEFDDEIYAVLNTDGEDTYYNVGDAKTDVAEMSESTPILIATYKLVKVERVRVVKETKVVTA